MPGLATLTWNDGDELLSSPAGSGTVYFQYAGGQRIRKFEQTTGAMTKERIYIGGWEVSRERSNGTVVSQEIETLHVHDDVERVLMVEEKTIGTGTGTYWRYQLSNHLGSASAELDNNGVVFSYEEFHPFGTSAYRAHDSNFDGVSPRRYRFTGMERDEETGLAYHGARYYAPWLGRWTASDPIGLGDGVNRYRYSSNNPTGFVDRTGTRAAGPPEHKTIQQLRNEGVSETSFGIGEPKPEDGGGDASGVGKSGEPEETTAKKKKGNSDRNAPGAEGGAPGGKGKTPGATGTQDKAGSTGSSSEARDGARPGDRDAEGGGENDTGSGNSRRGDTSAAATFNRYILGIFDQVFGAEDGVEEGGVPGGEGNPEDASKAAQVALSVLLAARTALSALAAGAEILEESIGGAVKAFGKSAKGKLDKLRDSVGGAASKAKKGTGGGPSGGSGRKKPTRADKGRKAASEGTPLNQSQKDGLRAEGRKKWEASRGAPARANGLDVHHRVPLEWSHILGVDPNRLDNLYGVPNKVHTQITNSWNAWRRELGGRVPSEAEVLQKAAEIDRLFGAFMERL